MRRRSMVGTATLEIPASGTIGPSRTEGLSDEMAMASGRLAARTLSDQDGFVTVSLESGEVKVIGYDSIRDTLTIGRWTEEEYYGTEHRE